jgi:hypothetical protein
VSGGGIGEIGEIGFIGWIGVLGGIGEMKYFNGTVERFEEFVTGEVNESLEPGA